MNNDMLSDIPGYIVTVMATMIMLTAIVSCQSLREPSARHDFVYVTDIIENIAYDMRYAGHDNFIGRPIKGYSPEAVPILTNAAARALARVQAELNAQGLGLKIFDAYRPQRAVNDFIKWAQNPGDTVNKQEYYPNVPKDSLFHKGYIAKRSGHTRGSTVDLTLVDLETGDAMDMGGTYDFFGQRSHHGYPDITDRQKGNRELLRSVMEKHRFNAYHAEWWHYTLADEPYPDRYFNFPVVANPND